MVKLWQISSFRTTLYPGWRVSATILLCDFAGVLIIEYFIIKVVNDLVWLHDEFFGKLTIACMLESGWIYSLGVDVDTLNTW